LYGSNQPRYIWVQSQPDQIMLMMVSTHAGNLLRGKESIAVSTDWGFVSIRTPLRVASPPIINPIICSVVIDTPENERAE